MIQYIQGRKKGIIQGRGALIFGGPVIDQNQNMIKFLILGKRQGDVRGIANFGEAAERCQGNSRCQRGEGCALLPLLHAIM